MMINIGVVAAYLLNRNLDFIYTAEIYGGICQEGLQIF
jgi:hypothetical protein